MLDLLIDEDRGCAITRITFALAPPEDGRAIKL